MEAISIPFIIIVYSIIILITGGKGIQIFPVNDPVKEEICLENCDQEVPEHTIILRKSQGIE